MLVFSSMFVIVIILSVHGCFYHFNFFGLTLLMVCIAVTFNYTFVWLTFWMFPCGELVVIYFLSHFLVPGCGSCSGSVFCWSVQFSQVIVCHWWVLFLVWCPVRYSCLVLRLGGNHSMSPCVYPCSCSWSSDIFRNSASWSHWQLCLCCLVRRFLRLFHCVVWLWPLLVFLFFDVHPFPYVFIFWFWLLLCSLLLLVIVLVVVVVCDNVRK